MSESLSQASFEALHIYADGASRGNPGPSAAGWVLCDKADRPLIFGHKRLGTKTNNEAEYLAATLGLQEALARGAKEVVLLADSELIIRQIQGRYQVRNARLLPLYNQLMSVIAQFANFDARHVPRAQNALADAEANKALDTLIGS